MKKSLSYYMSLDYPVVIKQITEELGGGHTAFIPLLGGDAFIGDGDTVEEALASLNVVKKHLFEKYIRNGIEIPEPQEEDDLGNCSGRFVLRVPRELHRSLKRRARQNGVSLNQYCSYRLTYSSTIEDASSSIKRELDSLPQINIKFESRNVNVVTESRAEIEEMKEQHFNQPSGFEVLA